MKPSPACLERQRALAVPGMKSLLAELKEAKQLHAQACLRQAPPTYCRTAGRHRRDQQTEALGQLVKELQATIARKGGSCLLDHEVKEMNLVAHLMLIPFALWLGFVGVSKQPAAVLTLPLFVGAYAAVVKGTEQFR